MPTVIKVCVGSSCHLRGSYDVIEALKEVLKKYGVEDKVELQAGFCMGNCARGVTVDGGGFLLHDVDASRVEEVFVTEIYPKLMEA